MKYIILTFTAFITFRAQALCIGDPDANFSGMVKVISTSWEDCWCNGKSGPTKSGIKLSTVCKVELSATPPSKFKSHPMKIGHSSDPQLCRLKVGATAKVRVKEDICDDTGKNLPTCGIAIDPKTCGAVRK